MRNFFSFCVSRKDGFDFFFVTDSLVASKEKLSSLQLAAREYPMMQKAQATSEWNNMPGKEAAWHLRCVQRITFSPSTLTVLHHGGRDRGRWARQGHASVGIDDRNDFPRTRSRLLEVHLIKIIDTGGNVRVDRSRRQGDRWCDLLGGLDLVLKWRRVRRTTREG